MDWRVALEGKGEEMGDKGRAAIETRDGGGGREEEGEEGTAIPAA